MSYFQRTTQHACHTLYLVITATDSTLSPFIICCRVSPSDHFPIFFQLNIQPPSHFPLTTVSFRYILAVKISYSLQDIISFSHIHHYSSYLSELVNCCYTILSDLLNKRAPLFHCSSPANFILLNFPCRHLHKISLCC